MGLLDKFSKPKPQPMTRERMEALLKGIELTGEKQSLFDLNFVKNIEISSKNVVCHLTLPDKSLEPGLRNLLQKAFAAESPDGQLDLQITIQTPAASADPLARVKNIIAIASGKGGVGKSTTAVQLAWALARGGAKVGILDADIYGPSMPTMTGVGQPNQMNGQLVVPPKINDVSIISVSMFGSADKAKILRGPMAGQVVKQFLTQVDWGELDYLLIDYPPGTGDIQLTISQNARVDGAILVTTPQEVALIDVRKAHEMFATTKVPIVGIVETMSWFVCDGCDKKHFLFGKGGGRRLAENLGVPLLGEVPQVPELMQFMDDGSPEGSAFVQKIFDETAGALRSSIPSMLSEKQPGLDGFSLQWEKAGDGSEDPVQKIKVLQRGQGPRSASVTEIWQVDDYTLGLVFADKREVHFATAELRKVCPCASCVDETTGKRTLKPESIPASTTITSVQSVGNYAAGIHFDDGHKTGIFTFEYLRELSENALH